MSGLASCATIAGRVARLEIAIMAPRDMRALRVVACSTTRRQEILRFGLSRMTCPMAGHPRR